MRSEAEAGRAIDQYGDTVRRICLLHLKNHADTEDVFQTVFLKYVLSTAVFENEEHEKAWFIRVTLNACRDLLRSFFHSRTVSLHTLADIPADVPEEHREVLEAVAALPEKYREAVYLHYYEGYSAVEIGRILGKNPNTVYTLLTRARKLLKDKLEVTTMDEKLHAAFDSVHAEAELKERTLAFLARAGEEAPVRRRPAARLRRAIAAVAACLLLLVGAGSYYAVLVPVSAISVDVNPSLELSLNRLDRVISVKGFNPEGEALASSLDVTFQPYTQALEEILSSETVSAYLAADDAVSITVACDDPDKSAQMLSAAQNCAQGAGRVYCHEGSSEEVEDAHHAGMSVGKYQAFLELQALDPSVTTEEVQAMSMKEIRARIAALSSGETETSSGQGSQSSSGSSGQQQTGSGVSGGQQSGCTDGGNGQQSGSGSGGQNGHHGYGSGGHQGHE